MEYNGLTFELLKEEDIALLTPIMTRAFDEDSRIHLDVEKGGPEGYDDGSFLRKYGLNEKSEAYKISRGDEAVGCVILWINRITRINRLGALFIDTKFQNQGIGRMVWEFVEKQYPDTRKWCTDTPAFSRRNHNFYINKCGFHVVKIEYPKDIRGASYVLEKVMNA